MMDDSAYARAAGALGAADFVLVAAGAGFSADSGLPVYADVAKTPLWKSHNLDYHDLCQTQMLIEEPACGYGFWAGCARAYREASPHQGYHILERWLSAKEA